MCTFGAGRQTSVPTRARACACVLDANENPDATKRGNEKGGKAA